MRPTNMFSLTITAVLHPVDRTLQGKPCFFRQEEHDAQGSIFSGHERFFISCETTRNPSILGKPAAVAGTRKRSGIILAAIQARKYGVKQRWYCMKLKSFARADTYSTRPSLL